MCGERCGRSVLRHIVGASRNALPLSLIPKLEYRERRGRGVRTSGAIRRPSFQKWNRMCASVSRCLSVTLFVPAPFVPAPFVPAPFVPAPFVPALYVPAPFVPAPFVPAPFVLALYVPAPSYKPRYSKTGMSAAARRYAPHQPRKPFLRLWPLHAVCARIKLVHTRAGRKQLDTGTNGLERAKKTARRDDRRAVLYQQPLTQTQSSDPLRSSS
jgi:hypothetical protein